jgi:hypothetical protein
MPRVCSTHLALLSSQFACHMSFCRSSTNARRCAAGSTVGCWRGGCSSQQSPSPGQAGWRRADRGGALPAPHTFTTTSAATTKQSQPAASSKERCRAGPTSALHTPSMGTRTTDGDTFPLSDVTPPPLHGSRLPFCGQDGGGEYWHDINDNDNDSDSDSDNDSDSDSDSGRERAQHRHRQEPHRCNSMARERTENTMLVMPCRSSSAAQAFHDIVVLSKSGGPMSRHRDIYSHSGRQTHNWMHAADTNSDRNHNHNRDVPASTCRPWTS